MFRNKKFKGMEIEDSLLTATEEEATRVETPIEKTGLKYFWAVVILLLFGLAWRVFDLSVVKGDYYRGLAEGNRIREIVIKAPRGKIYDRHGKILVHNVPSVDAVIIPYDLPEDELEKKKVLLRAAKILDLKTEEIKDILINIEENLNQAILLKKNISQDEMLILLSEGDSLPGITIEKTAVRDYVDSVILAHILGYEGKIKKEELEKNPNYLLTDSIGKQGLEKSYEKHLRGTHGKKVVEVDSLGNIKREIGVTNPEPGNDLLLSLDSEMQKRIFDILEDYLKETESKITKASVVALNPENGKVLALVSIPSFDNNLFAKGISQADYQNLINDPLKPLYNRAIAGEYPPGSTIKPVLATAALSEGIITERTVIESKGGLQVGNFFFGDWKVHGQTDVRRAIAVSSDVFFYTVGGGYGNVRGLGIDKIREYEKIFGFGKETQIDLPGEATGLIPDKKWKKEIIGENWYLGNTYHASIGQGYVSATPLQLAVATAAIANEGKVYAPRLVLQIQKSNQDKVSVPIKKLNQVPITDNIFKIVQEGMRQTVESGTAQGLKELPVAVAGKTGTAQYGVKDMTHGWLVSFAPYENPEIAMVVLVEEQVEDDDYHAVPITKMIYEWYFSNKKDN